MIEWRVHRQTWHALTVLTLLAACTAATALDYTPHGTQPGLAWGLDPATSCEDCHRSRDAQNDAFMPHSTWGGSMMANATRDPLFWAALDIANADAAAIGKAGVGDYCLRCHTPAGWYKGHVVKTGTPGDPPLSGGESGCQLAGTYSRRDFKTNDYSGVDCHFCHRLMATGANGEPGMIGNANAWLDDSTQCTTPDGASFGGPCRRGPYVYAENDPLTAPHGWTYSPYHADSALCGTCHDVTTPDTDEGPLRTLIRADGSDSGRPFPIERTYTEWTRSLFAEAIFRDGLGDAPSGQPALAKAESCQGCHMRSSDDALAKACEMNPSGSRTGNLPLHEFAGANTWVPAIIKGEYGDGLQRPGDFDRTVTAARAMLQSSAAVEAAVTAYQPPAGATPGAIALRVDVINLSGHKLPTGYSEGRRMWLGVEVRDGANALIAASGSYDTASAALGEDVQVRVYEILQGVWDAGTQTCAISENGKKRFHFVLNNCIAKDNRIPPLGFRPKAPDDPLGEEAAPVGQVYPETTPGSGVLVNRDSVNYSFAIPASAQLPLSVAATLYYQTASRDYMEFLRDEALANKTPAENALCADGPNRPFTAGPQERSRGEFAYQLWNNAADDAQQRGYGKSPPEAMAMATLSVPTEKSR